jgi:hypothetical protein
MGIDPVKFVHFAIRFPDYIKNFVQYRIDSASRSSQRGWISLLPSVHDRLESAGQATGHYFWQDLLVAKQVFKNSPKNHLDVGSRVDGLIAHLLSFRTVDVLDIRPLKSTIEGLRFIAGDATGGLPEFEGKYESVSCLHAVEHFGLGRYGDEINSTGHEQGLINISKCVQVGGSLYLSIPLGHNRTQFNSQRLLPPRWPIEILSNFDITSYFEIPWKGEPFSAKERLLVNDFEPGSAGLYHLVRKH